MSRPADWHVLDLDRDPVPGDPFEVRELARKLGDFADDVGSALRSVRGLNGDTAVQDWAGLSGDAYREQFGDLPGELEKLERSYRLASGALDGYWPQLETAQADADRALTHGRTARADLDAATSQLTNADAWVRRAQDKSREYRADPKPGVPPPSEQEVRAAIRNATDASSAHTTASTAVHDAQARLDAAKELAAQAAGLRDRAASTAEHKLHEASDAGMKNKHWWEKAVDFVADHWDEIVTVCKVIVAVLGIVVLIIGGPLAWIVLAAALIVLADTLIKYAQGKASLWDVAFAALDCIPGLKGLTTAGGLLKAARNLPALLKSGKALGDIANSVRKGAGAMRAMARSIKTLFTCGDPIDMATGEMVMSATDVELPGVLPLILERHHRTGFRGGRWFGASWASTLDQRLLVDEEGVRFTSADGMVLHYPVPEPGRPLMPVEGPRWPLTWDGSAGGAMTVAQPEVGRVLEFRSQQGGPLALTAISDRSANRVSVTYDPSGAPVEVTHTAGYRVAVTTVQGRVTALHLASAEDRPRLLTFGYTRGRLTAVTNSSGLPLTFDYDDAGRITRWQDRNDAWYAYTYDDRGRCVRTTGADGSFAYSYAYQDAPRATKATDSLGHTTCYDFNDHYQLTAETDALGHTAHHTWDRFDRLLTRTDALGRTTACTYDMDGKLVTVVRPDGSASHVSYNDQGLPATTTGPDGSQRIHGYDDRGNLRSSTEPGGGTTTYEYDAQDRLLAVTDPGGGIVRIEPNAAGLPVSVTDPTGNIDRYDRDAFGRVIAVRDPRGGVTRLGWTVEGLPAWSVAPDGARETWTYDADGNPTEYRDPTGTVTCAATAGFGLPASRTGSDGGTTHYTYDRGMRLVAVTDPAGASWSYAYDPVGRLIREVDFNGRAVGYRYDAAGQLVERVNGAGQSVRYTRDALGRVVESRTDEATASFAYDAANRLVRASNSDAELTYVRDAAGRVLTETLNGRTLTSAYDGRGRRIRRSTPAGVTSDWEFDAADRLTALRVAGVTVGFAYDEAGRETHRTLGSSATLTRTWDDAHRLAAETYATPGGGGTRRWEYDPAGSVTRAVTDLDGAVSDQVFALDAVGRVVAVDDRTGAGAHESYRYDRSGNLVEGHWAGGAHAGEGAREVSGTLLTRVGRTRYTYDSQGRVTRKVRALLSGGTRTWTYRWDAHDRLTDALTADGTRWRYLYDPLGRRIAKLRLADDGGVAERVDFVWDGGKLAEQSGGRRAGTTTWEWQPGVVRPLVQTESGRAAENPGQDEVDRRFYAIVSDLVGTPTHLVDAEGRVAWRSDASLWGAPLGPPGDGTTCPLRFPGQFHDVETGLHYNYQRYYDPETARYQSPDPLGLAPAANHHGYVQNPLTWSDPMGLAACEIFYRVMSAKEFGGLGPMGEISVKGTENFVTQEVDYVSGIAARFARRGGRNAEKYTHLVRYQMQPGTRDALIAAARGSGDNIEAIREAYGLHLDEIGQSVDFVHLKLEREGLNFGLRPGSVDVFNSRILKATHTLL